MVSAQWREARAGRVLPFVVTYDGVLVGQLTIGGVQYGSLRGAHIGYWVGEEFAGRGIIPTAENIARAFWRELEPNLEGNEGCRLHRIRVRESRNNYVDYWGPTRTPPPS